MISTAILMPKKLNAVEKLRKADEKLNSVKLVMQIRQGHKK
jgi:hypothetical protein